MHRLFRLIPLLFLATSAFADESQPPPVQLEAYKANYFIIGNPNLKTQISFKARVLGDNLYFGFSQRLFWDLLYVESSPVLDVNYNPDLFYRFRPQDSAPDSWLDFGIFEHESNGLAGYGSRMWNMSYLRYHSVLPLSGTPGGARLFWSIKVWAPYLIDLQAQDLVQYRGIYELNLTWANFLSGWLKDSDISFRLYPGGYSWINPLKGGQELTLRMHPDSRRFTPALFIQAFHGYAETMLNYNRSTFGLRAGMGF